MEITRLKINGVENPVGFKYRKVKLSWTVENFTRKYQKNVKIEVALDKDFGDTVSVKEGANLQS